jgi:hypothetical protein
MRVDNEARSMKQILLLAMVLGCNKGGFESEKNNPKSMYEATGVVREVVPHIPVPGSTAGGLKIETESAIQGVRLRDGRSTDMPAQLLLFGAKEHVLKAFAVGDRVFFTFAVAWDQPVPFVVQRIAKEPLPAVR